MIKQLVPEEVCLKCKGCCRFREENSVWSPCLLDAEIQDLLDKKIPSVSMTIDKRVHLIPAPSNSGAGFLCPFLKTGENKCQIYGFRPFECQLYPFLISMRNGKVYLTVDLNCPYIKGHLKDEATSKYIEYLSSFLNSANFRRTIRDNPQLMQAYTEVLDVLELSI